MGLGGLNCLAKSPAKSAHVSDGMHVCMPRKCTMMAEERWSIACVTDCNEEGRIGVDC